MHGRHRPLLLSTFAALIAWQTAVKAAPVRPLYVYPALYAAQSDSHRNADSDYGFQITAGYRFADEWAAELVSESTKFKLDSGTGRFKQWGISAQVLYFPPVSDLGLKPILIGGVGWLHSSLGNFAENNVVARGGLGVGWQVPSWPLAIRADAVVRHEFGSKANPGINAYDDFVYSLGLIYQFWQLWTPHSAVSAPGSEGSPRRTSVELPHQTTIMDNKHPEDLSNDRDGDGILNAQDKCPDTPHGAVVDADGCILFLRKP